jgi:RNA polymerase sigma factor (sigma-70 family)
VEASTLQAPAGLARHRIAIGIPLLRLRSDEQLVALFRAGHEDAFRVIHDRYEKRLLAYARQMLPRGQDAEDALQDVFVRAYSGLRSNGRELALRAWLFRVAHNRCIDELRRPALPPPEVLEQITRTAQDPAVELDRRESLRRLIADVRRLPEQQRSALLMREMGGVSYAELACTLGTSVPAVKSLLVRARIALAQAASARDTACSEIREELVCAHDRGVRPNANAKRHMRDCTGCRSFKRELRSVNRQLAALVPLGPIGLLAKMLGFSSGAGAGSSATAGGTGGATAGGATAGGGVAAVSGATTGGGALASGALVVGSGHVATLLAAAVATAGGAVAISAPATQPIHARVPAKVQGAGSLAGRLAGIAAYAATGAPDAAASAAGVSTITQAKLKTPPQGTARARHKPVAAAAPAPSASSAYTGTANPSSGTVPPAGSSTAVNPAVNSATNPSGSTTPAPAGSSTYSSGADPQPSNGPGGTTQGGNQPSGTTTTPAGNNSSTPSGSNGGTGTGSSPSPDTGTGSGSTGSSAGSSGGTTTTSSK